jgi:hypothetical protein
MENIRMQKKSAGAGTVATLFSDQEGKDLIQESLPHLDDGRPQQPTATKVPSL